MNAQYNADLCFYEGSGTVKDIDQEFYWWRLAAAQGHENAQHNIDVDKESVTPTIAEAAIRAPRSPRSPADAM